MKSSLGGGSFVILAVLGLGACSGRIGDIPTSVGNGSSSPAGTGPGGGSDSTGDACKPGASLASARISLISDEQYVNVVHDVFGVTLTGDISTIKSSNGEYNVSESEAVANQAIAQAYVSAADKVVADPAFLPCGSAVGAATVTCMRQFLADKLPLAWRRPVTEADLASLMAVFNVGADDSPARAVQLTMEAALSSPHFLYRFELGDNARATSGVSTLSPYEVASALSFALTNSSPDPTLWGAAKDGTITQVDVLRAQVERVMALPIARANLQKKVSYYLDFEKMPLIDKDATLFPEFAGLRGTLYQSAQRFLGDVLWDGHFNDLFTSRRIYANQAMATVYGIAGVTGVQLVPVDTTGDAYGSGVLTQPALLATSNQHTGTDDIVHRGLWVYGNLACGIAIGDPPADAAAVFATITGTERQKTIKRDKLSCGGCHQAFDPFGLVTSSYDAIGRYRTTDENGAPIDDSATVSRLGSDLDGPVANVGALAQKLASGRRASDCAATRLSTYTLEHNPDVENSCLLQTVKDEFHTSGSFPALFKAIFTSPAFLTRDL